MESRTLEIELLYAKDLNKVNLITKMDVYVVVSISGGDNNSKQKTKSSVDHDGDNNPTWNFPMKFTVDEAALQQNRLTLDFMLVCGRALGDKDIGEVNVPVKELLDSPSKVEGKQILSYQVRKPSGKPKGQLTFAYKFGDKTAAALPHAAEHVLAHPPEKVDGEPMTAYPAGTSALYPPPPSGVYPPPVAAYSAGASSEAGGHYPPPAGYPPANGAPPPGVYPPLAPSGYGYPPPPSPHQGYAYPPHPGYAYPPQPGYAYPPQPSYGYPPQPVQQQPKKNKFGLGLGAGLLGGAVGGLLVGNMISDMADFDCGGGFDF
ncbi:protein SRC2-like [Primulina huaijiensis]|uniref:protein SRC2-like n=1 Tax=Primulina huaijiensis TaxID=1492673 RepID=UPI003CC754A7